jgi:hypothetical protein
MSATFRKQERGQAMAELAVCAIMFVTVLTFGIHFGELGYISEKVHEADQHAMWDSTAYRVFNYGTNVYNATPAANRVAMHTNGLYQNYAGLTSEVSSFTTPPALVDTKTAAPLNVTCVREPSMFFPTLLPVTAEPNGVSCFAEGQTSPLGFAAGSMGGSGTVLPTITSLCGVGKASGIGGNCANNKTSMLLGDFGLAGPPNDSENGDCALGGGCINAHFHNLADVMWNAAPSTGYAPYGQYVENWANGVDVPGWFGVPGVPSHVTDFYMSFRGEDSPHGPFTEQLGPMAGGSGNGTLWQTSPYQADPPMAPVPQPYAAAYGPRKACQTANIYCFLGRDPCN